MGFKVIKKEYKHNNCDKLNKELEEFLSGLTFQSEGLTENFMDIVLDHSNQKEKGFDELYNAPLDWLESLLIKTQREVLDSVINGLTDIVFTEKPKRQPNMNAKQSREWLIDEVKPLILNGITSQIDIAKQVGVDPRNGVMTVRVERAYGCKWKDYVDGVQHGRY